MHNFKKDVSFIDNNDELLKKYFKEIRHIKILDHQEEASIFQAFKNGDKKIIEKVIRANLRFVVSIARNFQGNGLDLIDLINAGNLGLTQAATSGTYDYRLGYKFYTYARRIILTSILKEIAECGHPIRIPTRQLWEFWTIKKFLNRAVGDDDYIHTMSVLECEESLLSARPIVSLDVPFAGDEELSLYDIVPHTGDAGSDCLVVDDSKRKIAEAVLSKMDARAAEIFKLRFGFYDNIEYSIEGLASRFGVSTTLIQQIIKRTRLRMRRELNFKYLQSQM